MLVAFRWWSRSAVCFLQRLLLCAPKAMIPLVTDNSLQLGWRYLFPDDLREHPIKRCNGFPGRRSSAAIDPHGVRSSLHTVTQRACLSRNSLFRSCYPAVQWFPGAIMRASVALLSKSASSLATARLPCTRPKYMGFVVARGWSSTAICAPPAV